jgi:hypothetical protein
MRWLGSSSSPALTLREIKGCACSPRGSVIDVANGPAHKFMEAHLKKDSEWHSDTDKSGCDVSLWHFAEVRGTAPSAAFGGAADQQCGAR